MDPKLSLPDYIIYVNVILWAGVIIYLAIVVNHIMLTTKLHLSRIPKQDPLARLKMICVL